jgi:hypothetical protein
MLQGCVRGSCGERSETAAGDLTLGEAICRELSADAICGLRVGRRTLGGIRVERPRFVMKLILTADWRSISLDCPLRGRFLRPDDAPGLAR